MTVPDEGDRLDEVELVRAHVPLVRPLRAAHGTVASKDTVLVRVQRADGAEGWGECVALDAPGYDDETVQVAWAALRDHVAAVRPGRRRASVPPTVRTAAAALEAAMLDAALRSRGVSLAQHLGGVRDRVPCGVAVGMAATVDDLLAEVAALVVRGYVRVKLKIQPGWDVEPVAAVRAAWPGLVLTVDANGAYTEGDFDLLARLDAFGLAHLEQPLAARDLVGHARLARRLATPLCLDEPITGVAEACAAVDAAAATVLCVKPGRVGGLAETRRLHDAMVDRGISLWVGGMLETGIGKALNLAVASMPGFTAPGDLPESARWFTSDLTEPFTLDPDGAMAVPAGAGAGAPPDRDRLDDVSVERLLVRLS